PYGVAYNFMNGKLYVSSFDDVNNVGTVVEVNTAIPYNAANPKANQTLVFAPANMCAASGNPNCVPQTPITVNGESVSLACPMGLTVEQPSGNILATTFHYPPY